MSAPFAGRRHSAAGVAVPRDRPCNRPARRAVEVDTAGEPTPVRYQRQIGLLVDLTPEATRRLAGIEISASRTRSDEDRTEQRIVHPHPADVSV